MSAVVMMIDSGESYGERRARLLGERIGVLFRVRAAKKSSTVPSGETQSVMSNSSDMRSNGVSSWRVSSSIWAFLVCSSNSVWGTALVCASAVSFLPSICWRSMSPAWMAWCTKVRLVTSFFVPGELLLFFRQAISVWLSDCSKDGGDGFHRQSCFFNSCDNGQVHAEGSWWQTEIETLAKFVLWDYLQTCGSK